MEKDLSFIQHLVFNIFSFFQIFCKYDELELGNAKK